MNRLPRRKSRTHKGDYGRVLVVAGSPGMAGAAVLASEAAYRSGAGLVVISCPSRIADIVSIKQTCGIVRPFEESNALTGILEEAARCDVAVIGPGLSTSPLIVSAICKLGVRLDIPFVLDADGLNAFKGAPELLLRGKAPRVLTPHPGEASRLMKIEISDDPEEREQVAREMAKRYRAVVALKGYGTVVTDGTQLFVNETGNPGMATGGSGDVLAGIIGALIGQKLRPYAAACLGVEIHGLAGDIAAKKVGEVSLMATDLLEALPQAFLERGVERK